MKCMNCGGEQRGIRYEGCLFWVCDSCDTRKAAEFGISVELLRTERWDQELWIDAWECATSPDRWDQLDRGLI